MCKHLIIIIPAMTNYTDRFRMFCELSNFFETTIVISRNIDHNLLPENSIQWIDHEGCSSKDFIKECRTKVSEIADKHADSTIIVQNFFFNWILKKPRKNIKTVTAFFYSELSDLLSATPFKMFVRGYSVSTVLKSTSLLLKRCALSYYSVLTSDGIISNTDADLRFYLTKYKKAYNSEVDREFFRPSDLSANRNIVFVGSLQYRKGVDILFDLADKLGGEYPFTIVGKVSFDEPCISEKLSELIRSNKVTHIENLDRDKIRQLYENSFIMISPSYFEGSPRTVKEAASMGLYTVASDIPGHRMIADKFHNVFICDNEPESYISEIKRIISEYPEKALPDKDIMSFKSVAETLHSFYKDICRS